MAAPPEGTLPPPMFRNTSAEYTDIGLTRSIKKYQSGTTPLIISDKAAPPHAIPRKMMGSIMLKKNHKKIAPPSAVDLFLKSVEKKNATVRYTRPTKMVAIIKIRYSP